MMIFLAFLGHGGQSNFRKLIQGIMRAQKHFGRVRICKENGISDRISTLDNLVEIEVPKTRWDSKRSTYIRKRNFMKFPRIFFINMTESYQNSRKILKAIIV